MLKAASPTGELSKPAQIIRWIAVLPGSIIGYLSLNLCVHWVAWVIKLTFGGRDDLHTNVTNFVDAIPAELLQEIILGFFHPIFFIGIGSKIAPKHKSQVAIALAILWGIFFSVIQAVFFSRGVYAGPIWERVGSLSINYLLGILGLATALFLFLNKDEKPRAIEQVEKAQKFKPRRGYSNRARKVKKQQARVVSAKEALTDIDDGKEEIAIFVKFQRELYKIDNAVILTGKYLQVLESSQSFDEDLKWISQFQPSDKLPGTKSAIKSALKSVCSSHCQYIYDDEEIEKQYVKHFGNAYAALAYFSEDETSMESLQKEAMLLFQEWEHFENGISVRERIALEKRYSENIRHHESLKLFSKYLDLLESSPSFDREANQWVGPPCPLSDLPGTKESIKSAFRNIYCVDIGGISEEIEDEYTAFYMSLAGFINNDGQADLSFDERNLLFINEQNRLLREWKTFKAKVNAVKKEIARLP